MTFEWPKRDEDGRHVSAPQWQKASETLPINDENDPRFDGNWFECDVIVKTESGTEPCQFYACWSNEMIYDGIPYLLTEFDCESKVIEWRYI